MSHLVLGVTETQRNSILGGEWTSQSTLRRRENTGRGVGEGGEGIVGHSGKHQKISHKCLWVSSDKSESERRKRHFMSQMKTTGLSLVMRKHTKVLSSWQGVDMDEKSRA